MKHNQRKPRDRVGEAVHLYELHNNPNKWQVYIEFYDGSRADLVTIERAPTGTVAVIDMQKHVLFRYPNIEAYDASTDLMLFIAAAPSWWLHGWRSAAHRRKRWAQTKAQKQKSRANLRNQFAAKFKGPRWGWLPFEYVTRIPKKDVTRGNRSWAKRIKHMLWQPTKSTTTFIIDEALE